jgi:hypothetical protein
MRRLSDVVGSKIQQAIGALPVAEEIRDRITWDLIGAVLPRGGNPVFSYVLMLCVPVPFSDEDFEAPLKPLPDANPTQEQVNEIIRELYAEAQAGWSVPQAARPEERTPGGLIRG